MSATTPTTWLQRFGDALQLLCGGKRPSNEMMAAWADKSSEELQSFAASHGPAWAQGLGVIDAAHILADQPTEGVEHEHRALEAQQVPAVPEGWVLVPVKLTREMAMAWKQAGEVAMSTNSTRYAAMLNAAPTAPAPKEKP